MLYIYNLLKRKIYFIIFYKRYELCDSLYYLTSGAFIYLHLL